MPNCVDCNGPHAYETRISRHPLAVVDPVWLCGPCAWRRHDELACQRDREEALRALVEIDRGILPAWALTEDGRIDERSVESVTGEALARLAGL